MQIDFNETLFFADLFDWVGRAAQVDRLVPADRRFGRLSSLRPRSLDRNEIGRFFFILCGNGKMTLRAGPLGDKFCLVDVMRLFVVPKAISF